MYLCVCVEGYGGGPVGVKRYNIFMKLVCVFVFVCVTYVGPGRGGFSLPYNMGDGDDDGSWCTLGFPQGDARFPTCEDSRV